jgi:hypothetical protein
MSRIVKRHCRREATSGCHVEIMSRNGGDRQALVILGAHRRGHGRRLRISTSSMCTPATRSAVGSPARSEARDLIAELEKLLAQAAHRALDSQRLAPAAGATNRERHSPYAVTLPTAGRGARQQGGIPRPERMLSSACGSASRRATPHQDSSETLSLAGSAITAQRASRSASRAFTAGPLSSEDGVAGGVTRGQVSSEPVRS